jgi:hypothetical protein
MEPGERLVQPGPEFRGSYKMAHENDEPVGSQTIVDVNEFVKVKVPHAIDMEADIGARSEERIQSRSDFKIRLADTMGRRSSASMLIEKMYSWRGYQAAGLGDQRPNRVTLVASAAEQTIGTISIGFDSAVGLLIDQLYKPEIDALRSGGHSVCEFTKLAVDASVKSKRVLASLFHIAHIFSHHVRGCSPLMIEVNPRHVKFYERMLGFRSTGEERLNPRVNAPAVLLQLELDYARKEIQRLGGRSELAATEKSLYPFFFSPMEEKGILGRLLTL